MLEVDGGFRDAAAAGSIIPEGGVFKCRVSRVQFIPTAFHYIVEGDMISPLLFADDNGVFQVQQLLFETFNLGNEILIGDKGSGTAVFSR